MQIASINETDHADFLALINAEIRPDRAKTNAWDDFPLILSLENREWCIGAYTSEGQLVAGLACLIRSFQTSCGPITMAGIGSVVTKGEFRGQGLSSALQIEMLSRLQRKNVPLAVLWTDKPEIYAGRGFTSAGYEFHLDFNGALISGDVAPGFRVESFQPQHISAVERLFLSHDYYCLRESGDSQQLYLMPGTSGFVLVDSANQVQAYVFCEKGGDFPSYVLEWGGRAELVLPLLHRVRSLGKATQVLVPAGAVDLAEYLIQAGSSWAATSSGYWNVVNIDALKAVLGSLCDSVSQEQLADPAFILGTVDTDGKLQAGLIELAIWGFDSV